MIVGSIKLASACSIGIKILNPVIKIIGNAKPTIPLITPAMKPIKIIINNITGSFNVGDYVYPQANGTAIQCVAKTNPTFEEYQLCVGKIWATQSDGKPLVAVKIG